MAGIEGLGNNAYIHGAGPIKPSEGPSAAEIASHTPPQNAGKSTPLKKVAETITSFESNVSLPPALSEAASHPTTIALKKDYDQRLSSSRQNMQHALLLTGLQNTSTKLSHSE